MSICWFEGMTSRLRRVVTVSRALGRQQNLKSNGTPWSCRLRATSVFRGSVEAYVLCLQACKDVNTLRKQRLAAVQGSWCSLTPFAKPLVRLISSMPETEMQLFSAAGMG